MVFINLQISIAERNVENYIRSFVDTSRSERTFEFVPDQAVAAAQPGTFINWALEDERRYLAQLLQATPADSFVNVTFVEQVGDRVEGATTATLTQNYTLTAQHSQRAEGISGEIKGQARFSLERNDSGDWAIYRWEDFKLNTEEVSWTELKAFFQ